MTPEARTAATIEILGEVEATSQPVDRFVKYWFSGHRFAGSRDRAAISDRVFAVLRNRAEFAWRMKSEAPRALVISSLLAEGNAPEAVEDLFQKGGYGPEPLSESEREALYAVPLSEPPDEVKGGYPKWLEPQLKRAFGERLMHEMRAMLDRAPVDLRVNTLKADPAKTLKELVALGFNAAPTPYSPFGLRIPPGAGLGMLRQSALFKSGAIELQDEASQVAALVCGATPGQRVLDLAAGAGGKSLALAALMKNEGEIVACDTDPRRLANLAPRAERAGASIIRPLELMREQPEGKFDLVLVDAPCSGSGTWRRSPELKWRLEPKRLDEFAALQLRLLERATPHVGSDGRLVYATCSILPKENAERIHAFLEAVPGFETEDISSIWRDAVGTSPPPGVGHFFAGTPASTGTDGFFACALARN